MKSWKWLGLAIPALIFIFFALASVLEVGIDVKETFPPTLAKSAFLFDNCSSENGQITLKTITIENNFLFAIQKPIVYYACLYSDSSNLNAQMRTQVYLDGVLNNNLGYYGGIYAISMGRSQGIEIKSGQKKEIEVKADICQRNTIANFDKADKIYIFNQDEIGNKGYNCQNLLVDYKDKADTIILT